MSTDIRRIRAAVLTDHDPVDQSFLSGVVSTVSCLGLKCPIRTRLRGNNHEAERM